MGANLQISAVQREMRGQENEALNENGGRRTARKLSLDMGSDEGTPHDCSKPRT